MSQTYDSIAIYGLYDSDGVIRYVGKTVHLWTRFLIHINRGRDWVIGIKVLEWANKETWKMVEQKWINSFPVDQLENKNDGGGGTPHHTEETKLKIGLASRLQVRTAERYKKISDAQKGRKRGPMSETVKEKLRNRPPLTAVQREILSLAVTKWWQTRKEGGSNH